MMHSIHSTDEMNADRLISIHQFNVSEMNLLYEIKQDKLSTNYIESTSVIQTIWRKRLYNDTRRKRFIQ